MQKPPVCSWSRSLDKQATLAASFEVAGIGLHGGREARVKVSPLPAESGIRFKRTKAGHAECVISATWQNRESAYLCTALKIDETSKLRTIEHLMASLAAFAVDNALIEVEGDELPIFDGSAVRWCHNILGVGLREQDAPRRYIKINEPIEVREPSGHFLRIEPAEGLADLQFDIGVSFPGCGDMKWTGAPLGWRFLNEVAPSRSFGLLTWGLPLKIFHLFSRQALLRGANIFTTGIVWRGRFIGGMRVEDEPVRHRVLDLLGDMSLAGAPMIGKVSGYAPRHDLNHEFVRAIMQKKDAWALVTVAEMSDGVPRQGAEA